MIIIHSFTNATQRGNTVVNSENEEELEKGTQCMKEAFLATISQKNVNSLFHSEAKQTVTLGRHVLFCQLHQVCIHFD